MKIAQRLITAAFAATVAITAVGCVSTSKQESAGEYVDDAVITTKVKAALAQDPSVKATEVNVETFKGDVQLSGFVADPASAQRAVELARGVKGVTSVKNDIRVK
ncbi:BON domain-containing protein [Massilia niastensis]|uniref:BON domain-containing protein n=1 Tax=Massilia niastensis TaxID=544911 RepID=UPI000366EBBE|nr:BON domain-containing protein [Massilia niastensis]